MTGFSIIKKVLAEDDASYLQNRTDIISWLGLFEGVGKFIFEIGFFLCVISILWAGVLFLIAGGNAETIAQGKRSLVWAAVGMGIMLIGQGIILSVRVAF